MYLNRPNTLEDRAIDYAHSKRKAWLDTLAAQTMYPVAGVAAFVTRCAMGFRPSGVIFEQLRIG